MVKTNEMTLKASRQRVLLLHLSFWSVYLSFFLYQVSSYQRGEELEWNRILITVFTHVIFAAIISYINYFYLLPQLLERKKILGYLIKFGLLFTIIIVIRIELNRYLFDLLYFKTSYMDSTRFVVQVVTSNLFIVIFVGMLRFAQDWFELDAKRKEIEHEKLIAELNFLKAQINPHFLFNTLNNLYYLAYSKSDNTTEVIDKLSKMMRYMIYDSNHSKVLLSKEIEYMKNYVSLERLRLNDEIPIEFEVKGNLDDRQIAPLIFIAFLENAFKHGVSNAKDDCWVKVLIEVNGKECTYTVENSKVHLQKEEGKSGIGLSNIKRRLELSYPNDHELQVKDLKDSYFVQLKLNLI
ncbi:MAG TPA: histidine kinase [Cyclobacteriaceae bacterium]|nr:histidine kinase [Cyclobacteriaceae bacterium]